MTETSPLPAPSDPLLDLDLAGAARAIEAGELDPVALAEAYLDRIAATEPSINAYFTVDAAGARAAAASARDEIAAGRYRGPLHGIPVGVKDLFDTAGLRTTYGSPRYADHVPTCDAVTVARLRSAGAVILGKQATHEFAWGGRTDSRFFGPTRNPHDAQRIPGGSSGGGAASIVARSSLLAIGSDTAGSVRIPAAFCGCVGYKPAHGWIDLGGVFPLEASLDHVGVMARTVDDAALAARVLGDAALTATGSALERGGPPRVGLLTGPSADLVDDEVRAGLARGVDALLAAGVQVTEIPMPGVDERVSAVFTLVREHAAGLHGAAFADDPAGYGDDLAELLRLPPVTAEKLAWAHRELARVREQVRAALETVDMLCSATEPVVAPPIGAMQVPLGGALHPVEEVLTRLTSVANATGLPAITVPAPGTPGLPVGVQLQCSAVNVPAMMRVAALLER